MSPTHNTRSETWRTSQQIKVKKPQRSHARQLYHVALQAEIRRLIELPVRSSMFVGSTYIMLKLWLFISKDHRFIRRSSADITVSPSLKKEKIHKHNSNR